MAQYFTRALCCEAEVITKEADPADRFNELDEESADIYVLLSSYKPKVQQAHTAKSWCCCTAVIRAVTAVQVTA